MENNNRKVKGNAGLIVLIALVIAIITASLCVSMYAWAKYKTREQGGAVATVAKWDVTFTKGSTMFTESYNYVATERLAPGTEGAYTITVNSTNTEVAYKYTIVMSNIQGKPTNLHFYTDAAHQHEITLTDNGTKAVVYNEVQVDLDSTTHKAATSDSVTIYWWWPYETGSGAAEIASNDAIDTADGVAGGTMSFNVTLTAWQVEPGEQSAQTLNIGDTVEYSPNGAIYFGTEVGVSSRNFSSAEGEEFHNTMWKVLSVNNSTGEIEMVPLAPIGNVSIQGTAGYNNGVIMLNRVCNALYGDSSKGITARSINDEDFIKAGGRKLGRIQGFVPN